MRARGAPRASGWSRSPSPFRTWPRRRRALEYRVGRGGWGEERCDLREVPLEARGGDDLQRPRWRVARVPEGMRHASWLEDEISWPDDAHLVPDLDADLAFEDVGVLVLAFVGVQRRGEDARPDRVLHEREAASAVISPDHEPHAQAAELHPLTLVRRQYCPRSWASYPLDGPPPLVPQTPVCTPVAAGMACFLAWSAGGILTTCTPGIIRFRSRTPDYKALRVFSGLESPRARNRRSLS